MNINDWHYYKLVVTGVSNCIQMQTLLNRALGFGNVFVKKTKSKPRRAEFCFWASEEEFDAIVGKALFDDVDWDDDYKKLISAKED